MFSKILIANRGEIALRIIRACKEMNIRTVAVFSEADRNSLHARFADEALCIGPASTAESYLNISALISAAELTDADGIHPGYGFLAENAHFAEVCESCGIKFIGPTSENIQLMGDKLLAKEFMSKHGLPVIPGSSKALNNKDEALKLAKKIGYPVIIKASAGGGGRGMRVCHNDVRLVSSFTTAKSEAEAAFGDGRLYIEKFIENPRHIEVQIMADETGEVIHLAERDCSIQRKHQKILEEAPSPAIDSKTRKKICELAKKGAKAANYRGVGTMEFLLDSKGRFYFIEMNTRIQVEHPITELVTGVDILKEQIRLAAKKKMSYNQSKIKIKGTAIECRINAEDWQNDFRPSPGRIDFLNFPGGAGVRLDTHIYAGYVVPAYYDSLLGKLICFGSTRKEAIKVLRRALDELIIEPNRTNIDLHKRIVNNERFQRGDYDTGFLNEIIAKGGEE